MNDQEITKYVIKALSRHHSINQITIDVCEKTGMKWKEAQHFIDAVQVEHKDKIARRQRPLLVFLAVISIVAGLTISGAMLVATMNGIIIIFLWIPFLGNIIITFTGLAMVGGGIMGILKKTQ